MAFYYHPTWRTLKLQVSTLKWQIRETVKVFTFSYDSFLAHNPNGTRIIISPNVGVSLKAQD